MAFTEAQLLADLITSNPAIKIISFIPVGTTATDIYVENVSDSKFKSGPMIQIAQTNTAAQAHAIIDSAMS